MSTICRKIANKRYKISFTTYLLAKVNYINLLIDYHFLFLGLFLLLYDIDKRRTNDTDRNSYHCHTYQTNNTTQ